MKKEIIIKFDIYQDDLDKQKPDPILYINTIPDREDRIEVEELEKISQKKVRLEITQKEEMTEYFGRRYFCRIREKLLKEILNYLK